MTAYRLVELQCSPVRGGFDTTHLQSIHYYLYRDLDDTAGELRSLHLQRPLDNVLDRLASENHLRGLNPDRWAQNAADYIEELELIQPFRAGNSLTLRGFASELVRKNQLELQWSIVPEPLSNADLSIAEQEARSASLRRLLMLAMDKDSVLLRPGRGDKSARSIDDAFSIVRPGL